MVIFKKENLQNITSKEPQHKRFTILIVDDEAANLRSLQKLLDPHYNVLTATNGVEALNIVKNRPPEQQIHLIITDQRMPQMTGLQFLEQTISLIPNTKRMILTGFTDVDVIIDSINKGEIYQFMLKPFEPQEMLFSIQRALEAYDLEVQTIRLNEELTRLNENLEQKVQERTQELELKNDFILKQKTELKTLLHVLCHDLATPLNSIMSLLDTSKENPDILNNLLPDIYNSIKNSLDVIQLIRNLRALEEEKMTLEIAPHSLKELIDESQQLLSHWLQEKNIQLKINVPAHIKVMVERVSMINSVLNNILSNAIKFSFPGEQIEVTAEMVSEYVILSIKDHGIGMPQKLITDLFKLGKATTRRGTAGELGTGFGMPLMKKVMTMVGGGVEVYSTEKTNIQQDHGTEIKLLLQKS